MADLKQLQKLWYAKLAASGFEDIEDTNNIHRPLKSWHSFRFNDPDKMSDTEQYLVLAKELLASFTFANPTHKRIWELHCECWSKRQIEKAIVNLRPSYKREQIGNIINLIAKEIK